MSFLNGLHAKSKFLALTVPCVLKRAILSEEAAEEFV
jgi:hypothetical protein